MFISFMDIFPVFDEFLPYVSSYLSKLTFLHNLISKIFSAHRAICDFVLPFEICREEFYQCLREKTGMKLAYLRFQEGKNWNFWPKYLTLILRKVSCI